MAWQLNCFRITFTLGSLRRDKRFLTIAMKMKTSLHVCALGWRVGERLIMSAIWTLCLCQALVMLSNPTITIWEGRWVVQSFHLPSQHFWVSCRHATLHAITTFPLVGRLLRARISPICFLEHGIERVNASTLCWQMCIALKEGYRGWRD